MSYEQIGERYARAVYEIGVETKQLAPLSDQIKRIAGAYAGSHDLQTVLENPLVADDERDRLLKALSTRLGVGPLALNSVRLLARRRRLPALPEIAKKLAHLTDERSGVVRATVTTAKVMPETYFVKLKAELEKSLGKRVVLERKQDPSLIAGVVTRIGDNTIDGSLKGRLHDLQQKMLAVE
jgi:F-type H+-transporting ATPase subunit delta